MYFVLGGGGKVGEIVARTLLSSGHEVAIIERSEERSNQLARVLKGRLLVVKGDCCDAGSLREAGIEDADFLCALTGQDDTNLAACEISTTLFDVPRTVARVNDPRNERIFASLGIQVVSSTVVVARTIEQEIVSTTSRAVLSLKHGEFSMLEVEIPNSATLRAEGGRLVSDLDLPPSTVLVALARGDEFDTVNGRTVLMPGDTVLFCTRSEYEDEARRTLLDL